MKTKLLAVMIERQENTMLHVARCLWVKANLPLENQAEWLRNKTEAYYIGMADGVNNMLEDALHSSKEYKGFHYIHFTGACKVGTPAEWVIRNDGNDDITKEPNFREWCRSYH